MRMMLLLFPLVLAGCGLSTTQFELKFGDKVCEEYVLCNPLVECNPDDFQEDHSQCTYDKKAAKDCLNDAWTCNSDLGEGFEVVEPAEVCDRVFIDCVVDPATGDDGDTADTADES